MPRDVAYDLSICDVLSTARQHREKGGRVSIAEQLIWGSGCLMACLIVQVLCISFGVALLGHSRKVLLRRSLFARTALIIVLAVGAMVIALTFQVWLWSFVYFRYSALPDWNAALYFSMVTFTSLGYGDIVLGPGLRIFATFGAVTGAFSFGLSTAFLVAATSRLLTERPAPHKRGENKRETGAP